MANECKWQNFQYKSPPGHFSKDYVLLRFLIRVFVIRTECFPILFLSLKTATSITGTSKEGVAALPRSVSAHRKKRLKLQIQTGTFMRQKKIHQPSCNALYRRCVVNISVYNILAILYVLQNLHWIKMCVYSQQVQKQHSKICQSCFI